LLSIELLKAFKERGGISKMHREGYERHGISRGYLSSSYYFTIHQILYSAWEYQPGTPNSAFGSCE
jgi:hypothetical protein